MKSRRRGFMLILAIFVMTFIVGAGLSFLSSGSTDYKAATKALATQQALALAESGIEDARIKLQKDPTFPPVEGDGGNYYSYSEEVTDVGGGAPIGNYSVVVDSTYADSPYFIVRITSTGLKYGVAGIIKKVVRAEIDVSPTDRRPPPQTDPYPNLYRIINWTEEGNLQ